MQFATQTTLGKSVRVPFRYSAASEMALTSSKEADDNYRSWRRRRLENLKFVAGGGEKGQAIPPPPPVLLRATDHPLFLLPAKPSSPPNSAASALPRFGDSLLKKKKKKNQSQASTAYTPEPPSSRRRRRRRRSKSRGAAGRAYSLPPHEFDHSVNSREHQMQHIRMSFSKTTQENDDGTGSRKDTDARDNDDEEVGWFKCGGGALLLCLFLSKGRKPALRSRRNEGERKGADMEKDHHVVISRTESLEKFECGSWSSSSAIILDGEEDHGLYFDLPLELIRGGSDNNDAKSPVMAAFVFHKKDPSRRKPASSRHDRFSITLSSPSTCITPRLLKARNDFNAFLLAHTS